MTRRRSFLGMAGAVFATVGAGCLEAPAADGSNNAGNEWTEAVTIEPRGASCGGPDDDHVAVSVAEEDLVVFGRTPAPNPCHEAIVTGYTDNDGEVRLTIDVESTLEGDESCIQCVGKIDYRARLDVDLDEIDTLVVSHVEGVEHRVTIDSNLSIGEGPALRTIESDCISDADEDHVEAHREETGIRLEGGREAPNPCHGVVIEDVRGNSDRLEIDLDVASTLDEGACIECVGFLSYDATLPVAEPEDIETVIVRHVDGEEHEIVL